MDPTLAWLLDPTDPGVRAKALVELAGRAPSEQDVLDARARSVKEGSVARVLDALTDPKGDTALYNPKYNAPFHQVIALAEMGAPGDEPRLARALERNLASRAKPDGGFGRKASHFCVTGNLVRAATLLGHGDDPRVRSGVQWLVEHQLPNGAWTCFPDEEPEGTLDGWEALGAFAALPERARPKDAIRRGLEYYLERGLGMRDAYEPWRRIHFPRHYYYDALVGLDIATALGDPRDARLSPALAWLRGRRASDGKWRLDAQHPDIGAGTDYAPQDAAAGTVTPLVVEPLDAPSRWATLAALRVLRRAPP